ncbi:MAG: Uma2 family endonuclease [Saprospiraceae bacterium]
MGDNSSATAEHLITAEEYFELEKRSEERHEFINGKLFQMAGESLDANQIGTNCHFFLEDLLGEQDYRIYRLAIKLRVIEGKLYRYPDVMVVPSASITRSHEVKNAELIIEVSSDESANRDRKTKLKEYTENFLTLQHYLIIDQNEPLVEMYSRRDGAWVYECFEGLQSEVPLRHFDASLPLKTIYKKVVFGEPTSD